jgi:hypothetical protein
MTIALRLFLSSAAFGIAISAAYWSIAHEPAGTTLLVFMTAALLVIAGYLFFVERSADLLADDPNATMAEGQGEHVGTFVLHSPAPFWIGLSVMGLLIGLVVAPAAAGLAGFALLFLGALMIVRSR